MYIAPVVPLMYGFTMVQINIMHNPTTTVSRGGSAPSMLFDPLITPPWASWDPLPGRHSGDGLHRSEHKCARTCIQRSRSLPRSNGSTPSLAPMWTDHHGAPDERHAFPAHCWYAARHTPPPPLGAPGLDHPSVSGPRTRAHPCPSRLPARSWWRPPQARLLRLSRLGGWLDRSQHTVHPVMVRLQAMLTRAPPPIVLLHKRHSV